ncbi:MAG TPA: DUF4835 family protein [Candidatus Kapabacteria bacterium]|nr:DUF4835 family protein [Candidatus Kapabacteria bacterium]
MKNNTKIFLSAVFLLTSSLFVTRLSAQEINAKISVNIEQIPEEYRYLISSLENDLTNYINTQKFTNINWEGDKIPIDINVAVTGGPRNKFAAQLFIAAKRYIYGQDGGQSVTLRLIDKEWTFEYNQGAMLSYNPTRYNEFTSLIDYYMLLIIGFDADTYEELSGTKYYDNSKQIVSLASTYGVDGWETTYTPGKFTRYSLVSELTDLRYEPLRKLIFSYYVDGLDLMKENKEKAKENLAYIIQEMAAFKKNKLSGPSVLFTAFFDAKALELAQIFKGYTKYKGVFSDLIYLDPSNTMVYQEAAEYKE